MIDLGRDPRTGEQKRIYRSVRVEHKRDAEDMKNQIMSELQQGTYIQPTRTTLAEYLREWVETYCKPNLAPSTTSGYAGALENHVVPVIGQLTLKDVVPMHLQTLYSDLLEKGLAPRMVQLIHLILHEALKHAVRWQLLSRNPADAVEPPRPRKATVHVLSLDEADTLLEGLKDRRDYPVVYLPLRTGMRRGELLALKWSDVDLAKRRLRG